MNHIIKISEEGKVKFELASSTWGEEEKQAILEVMKSNVYTMGEKVREFEDKFVKYFGMNFSPR